jgi:hypothetical protein
MAPRSTVGSAGKAISGPSSSSGSFVAWFIIILGFVFLGFFLLSLMMQVATNEAFMLGGSPVLGFHPDWSIFLQVPNLFLGQTSPTQSIAIMFGWGIELIYLGFIVGYDRMHHAVTVSGRTMASVFKVGSWGIVIFDIWTDANYGTLGSGLGGHLAFAIMVGFMVAFFGTVGLHLIEYGWSRA